MSAIFYVSYATLWLLLLCQGVLLLLVYRHFGLMALSTSEGIQRDGLPIGAAAPSFRAQTVDGESVEWRTNPGRRHVVAFVSPDCGPCLTILPALTLFAGASERDEVTLVVPGPRDVLGRLIDRFHPPSAAVCLSDDGNVITKYYRVRVTPFVFVLGEDGRVQAKGLSDNPAKLESLLAAGGITYPKELVASLESEVS